jgi:type IV secretory pathway component VirB8
MRQHEVEGLRPDPDDDKNRERRRRTVWLLAIIAGLLAAIAINLVARL